MLSHGGNAPHLNDSVTIRLFVRTPDQKRTTYRSMNKVTVQTHGQNRWIASSTIRGTVLCSRPSIFLRPSGTSSAVDRVQEYSCSVLCKLEVLSAPLFRGLSCCLGILGTRTRNLRNVS